MSKGVKIWLAAVGTSIIVLMVSQIMIQKKSHELRIKAQGQSELLHTQRQTIVNQKETIRLLKSYIAITDPAGVIMWEQPCNQNWDWVKWMEERE